jgi:putative colanic acid biosynthesis UDP-glucose lipid carrier transferase
MPTCLSENQGCRAGISHNEQYRKLICGYTIRHKVRTGITGWAQVNGLRGETETIDKMSARVKFDIDYLDKWSLWLDIKILVRTVLIVLRRDKARRKHRRR